MLIGMTGLPTSLPWRKSGALGRLSLDRRIQLRISKVLLSVRMFINWKYKFGRLEYTLMLAKKLLFGNSLTYFHRHLKWPPASLPRTFRRTQLRNLVRHISTLPVPSPSVPHVELGSVSAVKNQRRYQFGRSVVNDSSGQQVCYNCGLPNHFARNCTAPRASCTSCNGKHITSLCTNTKNTSK